jgi:hypothetical protein
MQYIIVAGAARSLADRHRLGNPTVGNSAMVAIATCGTGPRRLSRWIAVVTRFKTHRQPREWDESEGA